MSTISKTETPTGQEETAILLEEYERRIATLQESLKQAGRIHLNEAVILQEIKRVVDERDDFKRRLENAELLLERLKDEIYRLIDNITDKQPEGDGAGEEVAIKNSSGGVFYVHPCKCGSKNLWYAKKDVLVDDTYEIMCNVCAFHVTSDTRQGVIDEWNRRVTK